MKNLLVVVLTGITISIVSVVFYMIFILLWGEITDFVYVRLLFTSSIVGGGIISSYSIYKVNNGNLLYSILHGIFTSLIIFFIIGFIIVNIYGS
ncbi:MAG: hypothetical protein EGQ02_07470 [Enterobacter cloacae]|nr:hypothetical protein [Enterobacter cloacae]